MSDTITGGDIAAGMGAAESAPAPASAETTPVSDSQTTVETDAAPATAEPTAATSTPPGPIPFERHQAILAKERQTRESLESSLAWAREFQPQQVRQWQQAITWLSSDPVGFYRAMGQQLTQRGYSTQAQAEPQEPAPDLVTEQGKPVYSADQLKAWHRWNNAQLDEKYGRPLQQLQQASQVAEITQRASAEAQTTLHEARTTWEGFPELEPKIYALMKSDGRVTLDSAYNRVFREEYLPTLKTRERQAVLSDLAKKPGASTVSPSAAGTAVPKPAKDLSFQELFAQEYARRSR